MTLRALHDAVRLGDIRAAENLAALELDCVFARLTLAHARAQANSDDAGLIPVAKSYADHGYSRAARHLDRPLRPRT